MAGFQFVGWIPRNNPSPAQRGKYGEAGMGAGYEGSFGCDLEYGFTASSPSGESDSPPSSRRYAPIHFPRFAGAALRASFCWWRGTCGTDHVPPMTPIFFVSPVRCAAAITLATFP